MLDILPKKEKVLILDNQMALLKKGSRFVPSDVILVQFLYEKIHHGYDHGHEVPLVEYDLYGPQEPCDVREKFRGNRLIEGSNEDLCFFTKLKKMNVTDSRINRSVGSGGTWSAAYSREFSTRSRISHDAPVITAKKTHLRYENEGSLDHGAWIMHEFCLGNIDDGGHFCRYDDPYMICRLRKSKKGRNQKKLGMKSVPDCDHQPNVITKKPRLLEHVRYEDGRVEYSRLGSTRTVQPQIDEVLEVRNMSNNSSEFKWSLQGINGSSTSYSEDAVGINIENNHVVVEEHSNSCTTTATDVGVLTNSATSAETPMSFDDVFQFDNLCAWDAGVSGIDDADGILKYLLEGDDVGINIENDHVDVQTPMSFDDNVFYDNNLSAWIDQFPEEADKCTNYADESMNMNADAILNYLEENPHVAVAVAVAGGNELTPIILDYRNCKSAAEIVNKALQLVMSECKPRAKIVDICEKGYEFIREQTGNMCKNVRRKIERGVAFPTCISVNKTVCHFSPLASEETVLEEGDIIKTDMKCHIDGFIAVVAHTHVLQEGPVTSRAADVIAAENAAAEVALRLVKPGKKNKEVLTYALQKVAAAYDWKLVEGVLSHQLKQFVVDGNKVMLNVSSPDARVDDAGFEENEVYAIDIVTSTGLQPKLLDEPQTNIYKRAVDKNYHLKMKTSRFIFREINKKFPIMLFSTRALDDEKARLGLVECVNHDLLQPYPILFEKPGECICSINFMLKYNSFIMNVVLHFAVTSIRETAFVAAVVLSSSSCGSALCAF
ncbi:hypothetical protein FNV43_RR05347 [Rhamnella rubrinervis]|uniref:ERBB-3 BINDING PROTEIN 1 n=1 Tax=Rhamnella rubrinervis TaxID=2594499 RepID=A0A8K0HMG6_9ROSA|nr:hypothetical protein FNV43_RR05347 [Rhamnella rubrinervis]